MPDISISEFAKLMAKRVEDFIEDWRENQDKNGVADWPEAMSGADWVDQFNVYCEEL